MFIFCFKPVADRPFRYESEFDDLPKERLKRKMLFLLQFHFTLLPYSSHDL